MREKFGVLDPNGEVAYLPEPGFQKVGGERELVIHLTQYCCHHQNHSALPSEDGQQCKQAYCPLGGGGG